MVLTSLPNYENLPMPELLASLTGRTGNITLGYREKLGQSQSAQHVVAAKAAPRYSS